MQQYGFKLFRFVAAAGVVSLAFVPVAGRAQEKAAATEDASGVKKAAAKAWSPRRLPDGQPDLQGTYISGWSLPYERHTAEEQKAYEDRMVAVRGPNPGAYGLEWTEVNLWSKESRVPKRQTQQVVDPPDGRIPWQPWALAKKLYIRDNPYERPDFIDSRVRCLPAGPRFVLTSAYNGWQVMQTPGYVIFLQEHNHNYRIIPVGNAPRLSKGMELWEGDSRGRWEGNTLVVEVTNFTDKTWIVGEAGGEGISSGSFHSTALKLTERFTMADADNIDYEVTIEDPNVFTRPWKMVFGVWKRAPAGYENFEFACHEGNRSMELTEVLFKKP